MITRVLDEENNVVHDCDEMGCTVSWDGYALVDLDVKDLFPEGTPIPPNAQGVAAGKRVQHGDDPDLSVWKVNGTTAKLNKRSG